MSRRKRPAWLYAVLTAVLCLLLAGLWLGQRQQTAMHRQVAVQHHAAPKVVFEEAGSHSADEAEARRVPVPAGKHGIALILDDVGYDMPALRRALALHVPMAIAILPDSPHATEAARLAHETGHTVMLHMPMEPSGQHYRDLMDASFIRVGMSRSEVRRQMDAALQHVPYVVGVNNHMGSRLTALAQPMRWVMQVCREQKLFFIDSRTNKDSVAARMARKAGLRWGERRVFLDDSVQPAALQHSWEKARRRLAKDGFVIVIAHPHHETLDFLQAHLTAADRAAMVPVGSVLSPPGASAGG